MDCENKKEKEECKHVTGEFHIVISKKGNTYQYETSPYKICPNKSTGQKERNINQKIIRFLQVINTDTDQNHCQYINGYTRNDMVLRKINSHGKGFSTNKLSYFIDLKKLVLQSFSEKHEHRADQCQCHYNFSELFFLKFSNQFDSKPEPDK